MILVLDNYDSFTFNLVHLLARHGEDIEVHRSDRIDVAGVLARKARRIVISPGPGRPEHRGIAIRLIQESAGQVPILGVCLGHQALGMAFGGRVGPAESPAHGRTSEVRHDGEGCFSGAPDPFPAMRYHSLAVERDGLPSELTISAWLEDRPRTIMGLRHRELPLEGWQFHPESFLTPVGAQLVDRFLAPRPGGRG